MDYTLKNYYSKYFYIFNIFIFVITVDCQTTTVAPTTTIDDKHFSLINIRKLNSDQLEEFCKTFDFVLADVDVIFDDISKVTKKHVNRLNELEEAKKKIVFYKSTIDDPAHVLYIDTLAEKLESLNYTTDLEIFNPINALKWYFEKNSFSGKAYVIGDDEFDEFVKSLGIETIHHSAVLTYDDYYTGYNATLDDKVEAVIIGFDLNINLYKMTQAHRYLKNPKVQLFMTQPKSIFGDIYFNGWIKKLIAETNRTKQYIDRLDGIFGDYLIEKNKLTDKVLCITSGASGDQNFIVNHKFKPLLVGKLKVKKEAKLPLTYYAVDDFSKMPHCRSDDD